MADTHKARTAPCEGCRTSTPTSQLFYIRDQRLCEACGKRAIEDWNRLVRESEGR